MTLPALPPVEQGSQSYDEAVSGFQRVLIAQALQQANGVTAKAARSLNMERTRLAKLEKRLGLGDA